MSGAYHPWLYPQFSTPLVLDTEVAPVVPPAIDVPRFRTPHPIWQQFQIGYPQEDEAFVDHPDWEIPRAAPWLASTFDYIGEPIPDEEIPRVYTDWQYPRTPHWDRTSFVPVQTEPDIPPHVRIQWHVPWPNPVLRLPWRFHEFEPKDDDEREDQKPPYVEWHLIRPILHPYHEFRIWETPGGEQDIFIPATWEFPVRIIDIIEPFGDVDFSARDFIHGVTDWSPPPLSPPPPPRPPTQVPYIPIVVPDELFDEFIPNCPRPLRRPDTKC